jgi:signal transduction histidine kinase
VDGNQKSKKYDLALCSTNERLLMTFLSGAHLYELPADSEMAALVRAKDWSETPLGPVAQWSPTLRTMVDSMLANRFPMLLWWGPDYVSIYNDAYRPILGTKHPWALAMPLREVWSEIRDILRPLVDTPFNGGPATWMDDIALEINRFGFTEETHFVIAYSPVPDETAPRGIGGVLATVHEITEKIVSERRIEALRDLGARGGEGETPQEACTLAALALQRHDKDIPFALIYLLDGDGATARLAASAGMCGGQLAELDTIPVGAGRASWPLAEVLNTKSPVMVSPLAALMSPVPPGPWSDPPHTAVVLPLGIGGTQLAGFLVVGVSPRLQLDDQYHAFLDLVAAQVAAAVASARDYEEERKRAEALAEIDRAKTLFFSNVSHEFRTPLSLILGPVTNALDAGAMERSQIELVHRNSLRLLKLVNSLLDFSRIEAGRARAVYAPTDLAKLTADLASNFRSACERAGLTLRVDCPRLSAPVYVDRDMWEKIVLNLLSNAFKFTFHGVVAVTLRETRGFAELSVQDSGVGIPEHEIGRLFERFHRIEGQRSRTHEGSGIGLALVQELVKLHSGTIEVESAVGHGTTFTVRIPFGNAALASCATQTDLASTSVKADAFVQEVLRWLPDEDDASSRRDDFDELEVGAAVTRAGRVMLADDNADMRAYVRRLIGDVCDVRAVADGKAALSEIRKHRPDLVITDVMMPEMDGFELLREIRNDSTLRDIPVILLSARAGEESRVDGLDAGANDYLVKPFSARELVARVNANLEIAKKRSESVAAQRTLAATLENRVRERTAELEETNRRLIAEMEQRQQAEMALRQSQKLEAIGQLTGGVAHDFNNLLMVVHGGINILERGADGPRRERALRGMRDAADRGEALTRQLLAFSRDIELRVEAIDFGKLVDGMRILVSGALRGDIQVQIRIPADLWPILTDPSQLELAILNTVVNARDAMPKGGILTIRGSNVALDGGGGGLRGDFVRVEVQDTGVGIPAEILHRIFDPFFTTKPVGKGSGLGLSQVYGFAQQSGGNARVVSRVGEGTIVILELPRARTAKDRATIVAAADTPTLNGRGRQVLLVEDNEEVAVLEADMLDILGFAVTRISCAAEALAALSNGRQFDLVLSDIVMPGGTNGIDLAYQIKQRHPDLPVLLTTGYSEALGNAANVGFRVLRKPYSLRSLETMLKSILG